MTRHQKKLNPYWFICLSIFLAGSHHTIIAQKTNRSYQEFDVAQDYKGYKHLVLRLLVNFNQQTTQIVISQSKDGKKWVEVNALNIQKDYKASFQNVPLSIELDPVEKLLKNIDKQVYFRVTPSRNGVKNAACNFAQISKEKLLRIQAEVTPVTQLAQSHK